MDILPPLDLGTSNYDLNDTFAVPAAVAKNFPVGGAELAVMLGVGAIALLLFATNPNRG